VAKQQTFADKMSKVAKTAKKCPVCDAPVIYVKTIQPVENGSGNYRFRTQMTGVCKCNGQEFKI